MGLDVGFDAFGAAQTPATVLASRLASNGKIRIWRVGDSTTGAGAATTGSGIALLSPTNAANASGSVIEATLEYGKQLQVLLRAQRDDVAWLGTQIGLPNTAGPAEVFALDGWHDGHPGYLTSELASGRVSDGNTGVPGWSTLVGPADVVIVSSGTNDWSTLTGAQSLANVSALLTAIKRAQPSAYVLFWTPKAPPTASPNLVAWTAFEAGIASVVQAAGPQFFLVDTGAIVQQKADAEIADFIHPNEPGRWKIARAIFDVLVQRILPPPSGATWPRPYQRSVARPALSLGGTSTSYVDWTSNVAMEYGSGTFYIALQAYFTSLPSGAHEIISYGGNLQQSTHTLDLVQTGTNISVYFAGAGSPVSTMTSLPGALRLNTWQSLILHGDAASGILSLWVDGRCFALKAGMSWSPISGDYWFLGANAFGTDISMIGLIRNVAVGAGAAVPGFGNGSGITTPFRKWAEEYHVAGVYPPGLVACYLGGATTDGSGITLASAMGGASSTGAYNSTVVWSAAGVVPTPWDAQIVAPSITWPLTGTITTTTTITDGTILASDLWIFTRTVDGGTLTSPPKAVSSAGSATFTYESLDTSTYVYKRVPAAP